MWEKVNLFSKESKNVIMERKQFDVEAHVEAFVD